MSKGKIAVWSDSPMCYSGFAEVVRSVFGRLLSDWEVVFFGFNHEPLFEDPGEFHSRTVKLDSERDKFGRNKLLSYLRAKKPDYDILFLLQDHFVISSKVNVGGDTKPFIEALEDQADMMGASIVSYFPVDSYPYIQWVGPVLEHSDIAVTYTPWAKEQSEKAMDEQGAVDDWREEVDLRVIGHGCDEYPTMLTEKERESYRTQWFGEDDKFIFGFIGTNSQRKNNLREVLLPFYETAKEDDRAHLLMRSKITQKGNVPQGFNQRRKISWWNSEFGIDAKRIRFINSDDYLYIPQESLDIMYGVCDAIFNFSMEGWGLPITEAMSRKTLTLTANHGGLSYVGGEGRSLQVDVPDDISNQVFFPASNGMPRTQTDLEDAKEKMLRAISMDDDERQEIVDTAYQWTRDNTWSDIAERWDELLEEVK